MEYNDTIHHYGNFTNPQLITLSDFIYVYICPVMAVIGILGNTLAFIVLVRQPMKGFSVSVYLAAYCASGFLQWIFNIGPDWLISMTGSAYFRNMSDISCRFWQFLTHFLTFSGLWFLTGATVDRIIALWLPAKSQIMCTVFMAKNSLVFIMIGLTVVSIHAMWLFVLKDNYCEQEKEDNYLLPYWVWGSTLMLQLLPSLLLFIFGNMMFFRICLKHQFIQLPDASHNELDLTYTVMVLSFFNFFSAMPLGVTNLLALCYWTNNTDNQHTDFLINSLKAPLEYTNYLMWCSYTCAIFVLIGCCKNFRAGLNDCFKGVASCLTRDSSNIELQLMNGEYDQVPSTSTSV
ncbi:G-protein coupled receptor [Mactra antiquata]